jgi:hypothetical protein
LFSCTVSGGAAHWSKVIVQLSALGYESIRAVENPLTSLADDAAHPADDRATEGPCCSRDTRMAAP